MCGPAPWSHRRSRPRCCLDSVEARPSRRRRDVGHLGTSTRDNGLCSSHCACEADGSRLGVTDAVSAGLGDRGRVVALAGVIVVLPFRT